MPVNFGKIIHPVSIDDAYEATGESYGNDVCMSAKINRWAKFKPYNLNQPDDITDEQRKAINYGLTMPTVYDSKQTLVAGLREDGGTWGYDRPTAECMKRLTDFDGYDRNAISPFGTIVSQDVMLGGDGPVINCEQPPSGTDVINLADFSKTGYELSQWYFGIILDNGSTQWIATTSDKFADSPLWAVNFNGSLGLSAGMYTAIPFICDTRWIPGGQTPQSFRACGIGSTGVTVHLMSQQDKYTVTIRARWETGKTKVSYTLTIRNGGNSPRNFQNVELRAAKSKTGTDAVSIKSLGNFTVAAGATWTHSSVNTLSSVYQYLGIRYDGLSDVTWQPILEPAVQPGTNS